MTDLKIKRRRGKPISKQQVRRAMRRRARESTEVDQGGVFQAYRFVNGKWVRNPDEDVREHVATGAPFLERVQ